MDTLRTNSLVLEDIVHLWKQSTTNPLHRGLENTLRYISHSPSRKPLLSKTRASFQWYYSSYALGHYLGHATSVLKGLRRHLYLPSLKTHSVVFAIRVCSSHKRPTGRLNAEAAHNSLWGFKSRNTLPISEISGRRYHDTRLLDVHILGALCLTRKTSGCPQGQIIAYPPSRLRTGRHGSFGRHFGCSQGQYDSCLLPRLYPCLHNALHVPKS